MNNKKLYKEIEYRAFVFKMALRCGYIGHEDGGSGLTLKGWGYLKSESFWRFCNRLLVKYSKKYRATMLCLLEQFMTDELKEEHNFK